MARINVLWQRLWLQVAIARFFVVVLLTMLSLHFIPFVHAVF
ncbi:hypothetical protein WJM97_02520 [Okeanomitos corallinicola TIOX110]|uniref:Uncharacterized protein n=1 Tax=Okeanomitos corallinicola TIOX110 TaxID=3133117 RepID=A0ABZ2UT55_9CYAN